MDKTLKQNKEIMSSRITLWYLAVLVGAGALYVFTCAPAILWQDSGLFVYRIWHNDLEGNLGLALAHPLYIMVVILVKQIPFGDFAYRVNLISAVFGAVAAANLFLLLRLWLGRSVGALIGAITLAVSWNFWQHAVLAETYVPFAAQMFTELIVLLQYVRTKRIGYLYLLGLFNGLTIANHMWGVFGFTCYTVYLFILLVRRHISFKNLGIVIGLWVIGALPYEYLIIKNIILTGDIQGTLASTFFGNIWQQHVLNTFMSSTIILENILFITLNFPTPNILLLFFGLWALRKQFFSSSFTSIVFALLVLNFVFAFRYIVFDRYVFFLPFYCLASVFIGFGADLFLSRYNSKALTVLLVVFALMPAVVHFVTPEVARRYYPALGQLRQRPYRDEYDYFLKPWKRGYRGAERFANEALGTADENSIIYAYPTDAHALLYVQEVKGKRKDIKIVSDYDNSSGAPEFSTETIADLMNSSTVYAVSPFKHFCPDFLLEGYDFVKEGHLYRVIENR
jgi:hypothetical protein